MNIKNRYWILLLIICLIPSLWGIFHPGFFVSDDGHWMVIRLSAFYQAMVSGQFPVRFLPQLNNGFGYPVADFLYPLFLYIGSLLHVIKIPFLNVVKTLLAGSIMLSGVGMFFFLKQHVSKFSSFMGALVYVYLPYHLYDVYIRGSVGEVVSLAVAPFLFWAISKKSWPSTAVAIAILIPAHNTLALFFLPVGILYAFIQNLRYRDILYAVIVGLALSCFFWFPALYDKQYTVFDSIAVANPFVYFVNNVSFLLVGWIGVTIFIGVFLIKGLYKNRQVQFFFAIGILSLILSFSVSSMLWQSKLLAQFVQFPFRFLSLTILALSVMSAFLMEKVKKNILVIVPFLLILVLSALPYLLPTKYDYQPESFYDTNVATTTVKNEYMPKWVREVPTEYPAEKIKILDGSVGTITQKGTRLQGSVVAIKDTHAVVSFVYYPGWQATVDGKAVAVNATKNGLLTFDIPKGQHVVKVWFGETMVRLLADVISLSALIAVVSIFIRKRYEK